MTNDEMVLYYTEREVAIITGISRKTLQRYRYKKTGPYWIRFGTRSIRYPVIEFEKWMAENELSYLSNIDS